MRFLVILAALAVFLVPAVAVGQCPGGRCPAPAAWAAGPPALTLATPAAPAPVADCKSAAVVSAPAVVIVQHVTPIYRGVPPAPCAAAPGVRGRHRVHVFGVFRCPCP